MIVHFRFQLRTAENDRRKPSFLAHFEEFLKVVAFTKMFISANFEEFLKVVAFTQIAQNLHFWLILKNFKR